jgi:hypothetical protein
MRWALFGSVLVLGVFLTMSAVCPAAQEAKKDAVTPPKPVVAPTARLQAAKTAYVKNVDGGSIGFDTVTTTLEGWGRYQLVGSPEKADLLIEVSSPGDSDGGVAISSSTATTASGKYEPSTKTTRDLSSGGGPMRLVVRDAKTNTTLWSASEQVKGALKKNARENNLVEAAQKLMAKFHDRVEPVKSNE